MRETRERAQEGTRLPAGFLAWGQRVERLLVQGVILSVILLITVQTLAGGSRVAAFLGYGGWMIEPAWSGAPDATTGAGERSEGSAESGPRGRLALLLLRASEGDAVTLLRNGEAAARFDQPVLRLDIHDGDRLEIDNRSTRVVELRVMAVTPGVAWPGEGEVFRPGPGRTALGVVRIE